MGFQDTALGLRRAFFKRFFMGLFKDNRDLYDVFGYPEQVSYEMCLSLYNRGGLAKRIVNMPAEGIWSKPPQIISATDRRRLAKAKEEARAALEQKAEAQRQEEMEAKEAAATSTSTGSSGQGKFETPTKNPPPTPKANIDPDTKSKFARTWDDMMTQLHLAKTFETADKLAGMGEYSVIMYGFSDVRQAADMAKPVKRGSELIYVQAYSVASARIDSYVMDVTNPRFGRPEFYIINPSQEDNDGFGNGRSVRRSALNLPNFTNDIKVHYSRIQHITDDDLETSLYGHPRLVNVYNNVLDLIKVVGGAAETYWLMGNRGLHVDVDKEMKLSAEDKEALNDEIEDYVHNLTRVIRTRGVEVNNLGSNVADPTGTFKTLISTIAGATGIPQRNLIGAEAGQLASEQDRANWADYIESRRARVAEPMYLRPFINNMQELGILPEEKYDYLWPEAYKMNPLERAQAAAQKARVMANLTKMFPEGTLIGSVEEIREIFGLDQTRIGE